MNSGKETRKVVLQKRRWRVVRVYYRWVKAYGYQAEHLCDDPTGRLYWSFANVKCDSCRTRVPKYIKDIRNDLRGLQKVADG